MTRRGRKGPNKEKYKVTQKERQKEKESFLPNDLTGHLDTKNTFNWTV